jgi:hypothetical protein
LSYFKSPDPSPATMDVFSSYSDDVAKSCLQIRELIYQVAGEHSEVGPITEALKWGQPSFLTEESKSGTTIRLGPVKDKPDVCGIYVHCQTNLIEGLRQAFADEFEFEKNRAILISVRRDLPKDALALCIKDALTYHLKT